jgi:hypothetical protein
MGRGLIRKPEDLSLTFAATPERSVNFPPALQGAKLRKADAPLRPSRPSAALSFAAGSGRSRYRSSIGQAEGTAQPRMRSNGAGST